MYEATYHAQTTPTAIEQLAPVDTRLQRWFCPLIRYEDIYIWILLCNQQILLSQLPVVTPSHESSQSGSHSESERRISHLSFSRHILLHSWTLVNTNLFRSSNTAGWMQPLSHLFRKQCICSWLYKYIGFSERNKTVNLNNMLVYCSKFNYDNAFGERDIPSDVGAYVLIRIRTVLLSLAAMLLASGVDEGVAEKFPDQKYSGPVALLHDKYQHRVTTLRQELQGERRN